jgi:kynurenine formamidase
MKAKGLVWTAVCVTVVALALGHIHSGEAQQPWCPSKYGPADVLGAVNELTPEKVLQAVKLVKTGKVYDMGVLSLWMKDNQKFGASEPGIGKAVAKWLIDRRVTMVGADNWGLEVGPTEDKEEAGPVHQMLIPQNGIHILENLVTEALAKDNAYEFMFVLTKSKTKSSTGANVAPAAVR